MYGAGDGVATWNQQTPPKKGLTSWDNTPGGVQGFYTQPESVVKQIQGTAPGPMQQPAFAPPLTDNSRGQAGDPGVFIPPSIQGGVVTGSTNNPYGGALDPALAAAYARDEALRRLQLKQLRENVTSDVNILTTTRDTQAAQMKEQYNRSAASVASQYLQRGLGNSGITGVGITRFHEDFRNANAQLDTTYAQARAKLLKQIADAEATTALGSSMGALQAGTDNWGNILNLVSRYS